MSTTFTRTAITRVPVGPRGKMEENYTYTSGSKSITFRAHPTAPFEWVLVSSKGRVTRPMFIALVEAFVEAAFDKELGQTIDEVTETLTIE